MVPARAAPFGQWGRLGLSAGFALSLLLLLLTTWLSPERLWVFPTAISAAVALHYLLRHPLLHLCVLLAGVVLIIGYEAGIQLTEVLYAAYLTGFLAYWWVTRLWVYREPVLDTIESKALFLFLVWAACSLPLTIVNGGSVRAMASELFSFLMLGLFFPVREACARHRRGIPAVLAALVLVGLFVVVRNLLNYQGILLEARLPAELAMGRVPTNDGLLMVLSLLALVMVLLAERWRARALAGVLLACFFGGLLLTQSRGQWLSFLFGLAVLVVVAGRRQRRRILLVAGVGLVVVVASALLLGEAATLVFGGLVERFSSVPAALTTDVSLVNRFHETRAVWAEIVRSPIVGHGLGVSYAYYDIQFDHTRVDTFIHNGYASLWFKLGAVGLALTLAFWLGSAWRGIRLARAPSVPPAARIAALGASIGLIGYVLAANTSNPFFLDDTTFVFGVLTGLVGGAWARAQEPHPPDRG